MSYCTTCAINEIVIDGLRLRLRAAQREKREMFAKLSPSCTGRYPISGDCKWCYGQIKCQLRTCPLLKQKGETNAYQSNLLR